MRALIRFVTRNYGTGVESRDLDVNREQISVGRASDQTLSLPSRSVALNHAIIRRQEDGELRIEALNLTGVSINGRIKRVGALNVGDVIGIAGFDITVNAAEAPYDLFLLVEPRQRKEKEGHSLKSNLVETKLSKRRWSWLQFAVILLLFLAAPLVHHTDVKNANAFITMLPTDQVWSPGPLHPAHMNQVAGCRACHVTLFAPVGDKVCTACHKTITHHVNPARYAVADSTGMFCTNCHKEHKEQSQLVRRDANLCTSCHGDLANHVSVPTKIANVHGFAEDHEEFWLSLWQPAGHGAATKWMPERIDPERAVKKEQSNLKFPHDIHLRERGIRGSSGKKEILQCESCHRVDAAGKRMQKITMEADCRRCHQLTFDADDANRELPHGDPVLVQRTLEEFYARQFLLNAQKLPMNSPLRFAMRPGHDPELSPEQRKQLMSFAQQQAAQTAEEVFERQVCSTCHSILQKVQANGDVRYDVEPVRINDNWLPKAGFSHQAHRQEPCARCHDARKSESASDILIPKIKVCRECHGDEHATEKMPGTCIDCHQFHSSKQMLMENDEDSMLQMFMPSIR